jgi:hypothetical protein
VFHPRMFEPLMNQATTLEYSKSCVGYSHHLPNPILVDFVRLAAGRAISPAEKSQYCTTWHSCIGTTASGRPTEAQRKSVGSFLALLTLSVILNVTLQAAAFIALAIPRQEPRSLPPTRDQHLWGCLRANLGDPKIIVVSTLWTAPRSVGYRMSKQSLICRQLTSTASRP